MKEIHFKSIVKLEENSRLNGIFIAGLFIFFKLMYFNLNIGLNMGLIYINIISIFGIVLVLLSFSQLLKKQLVYLMCVDAAVTLIILVDLFFYRHFNGMVNIRSLSAAFNYLTVETGFIELFRVSDLLLIADFVYLILVRRKIGCLFIRDSIERPFKRAGAFVICVMLGTGCMAYSIKTLNAMQPGIFKYLYSKVYITQAVGNLSFHAIDLYRNAKLAFDENKETDYSLEEVSDWLKSKKSYSSTNRGVFGTYKGKNIIIIQVESMSQFVINKSINGKEITPNLNSLIKKGIYFDNFFDETGNGGTSDAIFTTNVSLYPLSKGAAFTDYAAGKYYSIANVMKDIGYSTAAMDAEQPGFWNIDIMYRSLGFNAVLDENGYLNDERIGTGVSDASFFRQSADKLKNMRKPFYTFMVTQSSHYPCIIPEKYKKDIDVSPYNDSLLGRYIESIHYTDNAIGMLLEGLEKEKLLDDTVIVVYGDHIAPIGRDDRDLQKFLGYNKSEIDDYNWLKMQKVPMILYLPGNKSQVNHTVGGHVDIMPTLFNIMGVDIKGLPLAGRDLLNGSEGVAASRRGYFIDDRYIYNIQTNKVYSNEGGKEFKLQDFEERIKNYSKYLDYSDAIIRHNMMRNISLK